MLSNSKMVFFWNNRNHKQLMTNKIFRRASNESDCSRKSTQNSLFRNDSGVEPFQLKNNLVVRKCDG